MSRRRPRSVRRREAKERRRRSAARAAHQRWLSQIGTARERIDAGVRSAEEQIGRQGYADLRMPDGSTMRIDYRGETP